MKFSIENENENTKKKTEYDLKIFTEYLEEISEHREIETMQFSDLQNILMKFILAFNKCKLTGFESKLQLITYNLFLLNHPYNKKNITRWLEDMNFIFSWWKHILLARKISFSPLENKIHIFAPPCNILYIFTIQKPLTSRFVLTDNTLVGIS